MKDKLTRLIACILVVALLLPITMTAIIPALTVSAAESVLVENRAEEEEREDSKSPTAITGNWKKAKKDGLVPPYGNFHNRVQQFIIDKYGNLSKKHIVTFQAFPTSPI